MKKSDSIAKLAPALIKAQAEIGGAIKDSKNPFFSSDYASLESVIEAVKPALLKQGITVLQLTGMSANGNGFIETILMHESGEYIGGEYPISSPSADPQKMGSATSYARRYALAAALNITQVDDDGNDASQPPRGPIEGKDGLFDNKYRIPYAPYAQWTLDQLVNDKGIDKLEEMLENFLGALSGKIKTKRPLDDPKHRERAQQFVLEATAYIKNFHGITSEAG